MSDGPEPARSASGSPWKTRFLLVLVLAVPYVGAVLYKGGLAFEPLNDEAQFWEQARSFAEGWPPSVAELRTYDEPMTPLAFLLWGGLERLHGSGISAARLATLLASLATLALIGLARPAAVRPATPLLCAVGLLLYPYWIPLSLLVYTDLPAALFVVGGFLLYVRDRHVASAVCFALAIATRQYMVTFPAAIVAYEGLAALRVGRPRVERWLPPLLAAATLFAWFAFFGGFGPAPGLAKWPRHTDALRAIQPAYALYALAAIGAYFVAVEFVLERRWRTLQLRVDRRTGLLLLAAVVLFAVFTPYYPDQIGPLNRVLAFSFGQEGVGAAVRITILLGLLLATVARFSRLVLGTWVIAMNAAIMPLLHAPWEKYYLPTLAALWLLKAAGALDECRSEPVEPGHPRPAALGPDPAREARNQRTPVADVPLEA